MTFPETSSNSKKPGKYLPIAVAALGLALIVALAGCSSNAESNTEYGEGSGNAESSEHSVKVKSGEPGGGAEPGEGSSSEAGGLGEEDGSQFSLTETFDSVRAGARLVLAYDAEANAFNGTVENTTGAILNKVRVEVHLSNGTELGPTTPVDLAPGQKVDVTLPATGQPFTSWGAHPEVGGAAEAGGEHSGGAEAGEHSSGGGESSEHSSDRGA